MENYLHTITKYLGIGTHFPKEFSLKDESIVLSNWTAKMSVTKIGADTPAFTLTETAGITLNADNTGKFEITSSQTADLDEAHYLADLVLIDPDGNPYHLFRFRFVAYKLVTPTS